MITSAELQQRLQQTFGSRLQSCGIANHEVTIEVATTDLREICAQLRDDKLFGFEELIDLCGVDYADYGVMEWATESTTASGFSRAANRDASEAEISWHKPRFAVVIHLLSIQNNCRLRVRCFAAGEPPMVDSVTDIWNSANWFEREAFDLYGILFNDHPDLRRILTDYGFIGHPFRKDFPISGHVEMRYDAKQQRIVYEPVEIEPRVLVPKVKRDDNRYLQENRANDEVSNG